MAVNINLGCDKAQMNRIEAKLDLLIQKEAATKMKLEDIEAKVDEETTVIAGVETLMDTLAAEVRATKGDPAKLEALANKIESNKSRLASAVIRNTDASAEEGSTSV